MIQGSVNATLSANHYKIVSIGLIYCHKSTRTQFAFPKTRNDYSYMLRDQFEFQKNKIGLFTPWSVRLS